MRRSLILLPLLIMAACSDANDDVLDPVTAESLSPPPATAIVTVDGLQYQIGCPYYPCPVTQIVLDQISAKRYFWLPPGTFPNPTIYLSVLQTPVQLQTVLPPPILPPPVTVPDPVLTGPLTVEGYALGGLAQVACDNFQLTLTAPDNGPWGFVSGDITYDYVRWDAATSQWVATGQTSTVPFSDVEWGQMLAGTFRTTGLLGDLDYHATFMVTLRRGAYETTVTHRMLCARQIVPPIVVVPPAPFLTGPTEYHGTRPSPSIGNLICSAIGVTLNSPDGGAWNFVSGERFIEFFGYDPSKHAFVLTGKTQTDPLTAADWQALLAGTYKIDLQKKSGPYSFTFNVTVERGQYQHTISHTAVCGGVDYFNT